MQSYKITICEPLKYTFGDNAEKSHPHIHAIASDGLFAKTGTFYVMPEVDLRPLEELFPANVFRKKGKINDEGAMTIKDKFGTKPEKRLLVEIFSLRLLYCDFRPCK